LTFVDLAFAEATADSRVRLITGSLVDEPIFKRVFDRHMHSVFHLATVPGGWAEQHFEIGLQVNLQLTLRLLEALRMQGSIAKLVFTSSIGVYGNLPGMVNDETVPRPTWSYGTHKAIGELLVADYSRKEFLDGRVIRLPAVVARGADPSGAVSAFMSDLIRVLAAGQPFVCPVSPEATCWWMSRPCAVDNILHAAALPSRQLIEQRVYMLPALRCSIKEIVDAVGRVSGRDASVLVSYRPVPEIEDRFGKLPPLHVPRAESRGFRHDGSVDELVRRAIEDVEGVSHV
jgi:nucleoside-diphosphate-sugar epimerase